MTHRALSRTGCLLRAMAGLLLALPPAWLGAPAAAHAESPLRPPSYRTGAASPIAGAFQLQDPSGRTVESDALAGRPYGLFFGFTSCPDICPTTLAQLSLALRSLPDPDLRIYFITVDPERDTRASLGAYMQSFDPRIVALTGDRPAVAEAIASFGIVAERTVLPGDQYTYGHTAAVLLVDANGLIVDRIEASSDVSTLAARLALLSRR